MVRPHYPQPLVLFFLAESSIGDLVSGGRCIRLPAGKHLVSGDSPHTSDTGFHEADIVLMSEQNARPMLDTHALKSQLDDLRIHRRSLGSNKFRRGGFRWQVFFDWPDRDGRRSESFKEQPRLRLLRCGELPFPTCKRLGNSFVSLFSLFFSGGFLHAKPGIYLAAPCVRPA